MNYQKLKSGSWRVRLMVQGQRYSVTFPYRPTKSEAILALNKKIETTPKKEPLDSFRKCAIKYIESKRNILSPSTVDSYYRYVISLPDNFKNIRLNEIDRITLQNFINDYSANCSPKTTKNMASFILSVFKMYGISNMTVSLPQKIKTEKYIPPDSDIKKLLSAVKNPVLEAIIKLACFGLRRSEIFALTIADVFDGYVRVSKALVLNDTNEWVLKTTKTYDSTRLVPVSDELINLIKSNGTVVGNYTPYISGKEIRQLCTKIGVEPFGLHALRHYFASTLHSLNVPDIYIQKIGGWSSSRVMRDVYTHTKSESEKMYYDLVKKSIESMF